MNIYRNLIQVFIKFDLFKKATCTDFYIQFYSLIFLSFTIFFFWKWVTQTRTNVCGKPAFYWGKFYCDFGWNGYTLFFSSGDVCSHMYVREAKKYIFKINHHGRGKEKRVPVFRKIIISTNILILLCWWIY